MNVAVDSVLVGLFGLMVGASELISRYRDAPWRAVHNVASTAYVLLNALVAVAALALMRAFDVTFGAEQGIKLRLTQMLIAGFGAIAFLRTSLFVVNVGGKDVGVGPATLLQVLLFATDRDVDRHRAAKRAQAVTEALHDLSYEDIREALPTYCLTLMQNVPGSEEVELRRKLQEIASSEMEDVLKANAVGLALMNVVGQKVLEAAAQSARSRLLDRGVWGEVYQQLFETLRRTTEPEQKVLDILGLTLYTAWPRVVERIEEQPSPLEGWTIRMKVVDPAVLRFNEYGWFAPNWAREADAVLTDVRKYADEHEQGLQKQGIALRIDPYALVPAVHGFKVGNGAYFISFTRWDQVSGHLTRPHQFYEVLPPKDNSARVRSMKELFDNWLLRAGQTQGLPNPSGDKRE